MAWKRKSLRARGIVVVLALTLAGASGAWGAAGAGKLDRSFSRDGIRIHRFAAQYDEASDVLVLRDGSIFTAGWLDESPTRGLYLARYRANGKSKRGFGKNGKAILDLSDYTYTQGLTRQKNGKLIVLAFKGLSADETVLARFHPDGRRDRSFSGNGYDVRDLVPGQSDYSQDVLVLPDRDILIVGWTQGTTTWLARYNPNGQPDASFGTGGVLMLDGPGGEMANAAVRQGSKILLAGRWEDAAAILRIDRNGVLDPTFGASGVRKVTGVGTAFSDLVHLANGRIVAAAESGYAVGMSGGGTLDPNFGTGGIVSLVPFFDEARGVARQPRNRVVVVGSGSAADERWRIVRLTRKGQLDASFSGDGMHSTDLPWDMARPFGVVTQTDGRALTAGMSGKSASPSDYHSTLIRYRGDVWTRRLRVVKRSGELRVSGLQFPARPRSEIVVSLFRRRAGSFVRIDRNRVDLGKRRDPDRDGFAESRFGTRFDRPGTGRCKVVVRQPAAPGFGSSEATKRFRC